MNELIDLYDRIQVSLDASKEYRRRLGTEIATVRNQRKLSQRQLAERLGVSHSAVARWEVGKLLPQRKSIEAIIRALDVRNN